MKLTISNQVTEEIAFFCSARHKKYQDSESGPGRVQCEGCTCAS